MSVHGLAMSWRIRGTYFESCNCDAVCPCRRIDGRAGGRSTHGVCMGVLSWLIEDGEADGTDLSGLPVALAIRYSDDEPGSPWTWILYLDETASADQRAALERIFTGTLGGDAERHFPWTWKDSELVAALVEVEDEAPGRPRLVVVVAACDRHREAAEVDAGRVPFGHDRAGEELDTEKLVVRDGPLAFEYRAVCGYASTFDYAG